MRLRVLSWNVRALLGDPLAVHRVLRAADADVVCLQEAPRRFGSRWHLASLARASGLLYVAGGRASAGTALLASLRADVTDVRTTRLPVTGRLPIPRGAVTAVVAPVGGRGVLVASVHLPLSPAERLEHVALLRADLAARAPQGRVLVAGDLNEPPGGPAWQAFAPVARDVLDGAAGAATFPARRPRRRIDAVLAGGEGLEVTGYDTWRADAADVVAATDHRPLLVEVDVPAR